MRPKIGVLPLYDSEKQTLWINPLYFGGVEQAGGLPLLLPLSEDPKLWDEYLESCDGFVFTGGQDIAPSIYGEKKLPECGYQAPMRDKQEQYMLEQLMGMDKPVLGICRGIQMMNASYGGTLYQDNSLHGEGTARHMIKDDRGDVSHQVTLKPGTTLYSMFGERVWTNSYHHQSVKKLGDGLKIAGTADDGIVEAIELIDYPYGLGIQWHPEAMLVASDDMLPVFTGLIEAAKKAADK